MDSQDDPSARAQEQHERADSYPYIFDAEAYSCISSTDRDSRTRQISRKQFVGARKGRLADKLNQRNVTNVFYCAPATLEGVFLVPYLRRSVRQPRGRIRGSRNIGAFRPPRCTVADMDGFLQVQEESGEVERKIWHLSSVKQMQSPRAGGVGNG